METKTETRTVLTITLTLEEAAHLVQYLAHAEYPLASDEASQTAERLYGSLRQQLIP